MTTSAQAASPAARAAAAPGKPAWRRRCLVHGAARPDGSVSGCSRRRTLARRPPFLHLGDRLVDDRRERLLHLGEIGRAHGHRLHAVRQQILLAGLLGLVPHRSEALGAHRAGGLGDQALQVGRQCIELRPVHHHRERRRADARLERVFRHCAEVEARRAFVGERRGVDDAFRHGVLRLRRRHRQADGAERVDDRLEVGAGVADLQALEVLQRADRRPRDGTSAAA